MVDSDTAATILVQNEVIISLLARLSFGTDGVRDVVVEKKRDPTGYIQAYNALDGTASAVDVAKLAKVDKSTMSQVLKRWASLGIVYDVGETSKPVYKNILVLPAS